MRLEQAIFTSVRSERLDGYQLAARSSGVSDELAKELTAWGPAHDSLWDTRPTPRSVNFHPLTDGRLLPFADHASPAPNTAAAAAGGSIRRCSSSCRDRHARGSPAIRSWSCEPWPPRAGCIVYDVGAARAAATIPLIGRAAATSRRLDVSEIDREGRGRNDRRADRDGRPPKRPSPSSPTCPSSGCSRPSCISSSRAERLNVSFTTGLKPSSRRPFKLSIVPDDPSLVRQSQRMHHGKVIEVLTCDPHSTNRQRLTAVRNR